ncbi:hypothetical protein [Aestuariivirga sp.]|uniref:hypothetical protein n=1 Tax=Aestuariivirga sp. TaxID=2650926 RepID=UPI00391C8EE8
MITAEGDLAERLAALGLPDAGEIAWATIWLEACGYTGLKFLTEALGDEQRSLNLVRDSLGLDLRNVSCAFLAPAIMRHVRANGRAFLRNVRHGLFLLPFTVREDIGIGCPVDPSFAVGGTRHKNPYAEKLAQAEQQGLELDDALWARLRR